MGQRVPSAVEKPTSAHDGSSYGVRDFERFVAVAKAMRDTIGKSVIDEIAVRRQARELDRDRRPACE